MIKMCFIGCTGHLMSRLGLLELYYNAMQSSVCCGYKEMVQQALVRFVSCRFSGHCHFHSKELTVKPPC